MNRSKRCAAIFKAEEDRRLFETLTEACEKTGWQVHAHCLTRNHFDLVLDPPRAAGLVLG